MNTMAPTRPTQLYGRRVRLSTGPAAAAEARGQVRAAICDWDVPVDLDVAVLLTSELVTNAILHDAGQNITLAVRCSRGHLRVDVYDMSCFMPVVVDAPADAEAGRGLMLVATLSDEWGFFRTPAGKAVYFTLAFQPDLGEGEGKGDGDGDGLQGSDVGTVSGEPPGDSPPPRNTTAIPVARSPRGDGAQC
jgi:anti-sigma regulatory factor (Ser/Thr protein kinase)